ncbi:uncharacterized protein MICPUCDRAFT_51374 [Micromonas pusilla CCMP1545]|uniref:Predicted protein n=1 Tax=Micromonas pusilla (strain CCMP1545) TaxID=564608 RepID=C1N1E8_MICPC|nr:uncharacterized protein MICPUCDRAFT_51374 [Micromonas pusilla CCMP1545]EEH54181.1 predicted protein [Micromonas pusilla CCMP1545]|eukprot:XP_003061551.1 predicted protein [Micromonas pusilla CCMP1545]
MGLKEGELEPSIAEIARSLATKSEASEGGEGATGGGGGGGAAAGEGRSPQIARKSVAVGQASSSGGGGGGGRGGGVSGRMTAAVPLVDLTNEPDDSDDDDDGGGGGGAGPAASIELVVTRQIDRREIRGIEVRGDDVDVSSLARRRRTTGGR